MGASNASGVGGNHDSEPISGMLWSFQVASAIHWAVFITLVAGKWLSLLMAGNNDEVYDKKPQRHAENNVMQW